MNLNLVREKSSSKEFDAKGSNTSGLHSHHNNIVVEYVNNIKRRGYRNERLNEFSNIYRNRRMPSKSALNIGENMSNSYLESNFIPEYPITYYSNQELINQCVHSLADPKQLYSYSSPVGDLEKTIENYDIADECGCSGFGSFTPTQPGALENILFEKRAHHLCSGAESQKSTSSSFEKIGEINAYLQSNRKNSNNCQRAADRLSGSSVSCTEMPYYFYDDLLNIDFEQYVAQFSYFERFQNAGGHTR